MNLVKKYVREALNEELTKTDKRAIVKIVGKELDKRLKKEIKDILDEELLDFQQAYDHLCHVLDWGYNHERPHSSLGYLTPSEFEVNYLSKPKLYLTS